MLTYRVKTGGQVILIPLEDISPPPYSSRIYMPIDELSVLSESIKENGILSPVLVKSIGDGLYQIISGERRRRAAMLAGISLLPCLLLNCDEHASRIINLNDNLHRRELHFLEAAELIDRLRDYMSVDEIAKELGIPEGLILSRIRLLQLPENIKWKIIMGNLNEATATALCKITDENRQNAIVDAMINSGLSYKEALEITKIENKKTVFVAHYKDYTIFENTIEHAVSSMAASGIQVNSEKSENPAKIVYTITIDKMI